MDYSVLLVKLIHTYCEEMTKVVVGPVCVVVLRGPSLGVKKADGWTDTEFRLFRMGVAERG